MRAVRMLIMSLFVCLALVPMAQAQSLCSTVPTVSAMHMLSTAPAPRPQQNDDPWSLLGLAAVMGVTSKARRMNLSKSYLFEGQTYGPGAGIEVPEGFPDVDDRGDVIFEDGSQAKKNQARDRAMSSPPSTGGINTGEGQGGGPTISGKTAVELDSMTKADLDALANELGVPVDRQDEDGNVMEGDPLKGDYVRALSKSR